MYCSWSCQSIFIAINVLVISLLTRWFLGSNANSHTCCIFFNPHLISATFIFARNVYQLTTKGVSLNSYLWSTGTLLIYSYLLLLYRDYIWKSYWNLFFAIFSIALAASSPADRMNNYMTKEMKHQRKRKLPQKKNEISVLKSVVENLAESSTTMTTTIVSDSFLAYPDETNNRQTQTSIDLVSKCCQYPNFDSSDFMRGQIPVHLVKHQSEESRLSSKEDNQQYMCLGGQAGDYDDKLDKQLLLNSLKVQVQKNLGIPTQRKQRPPARKLESDVIKIEDLIKNCARERKTTKAEEVAASNENSVPRVVAAALETIFDKKNNFNTCSELSTNYSFRNNLSKDVFAASTDN